MNGPSTNINDIVKENKRLSSEDVDMVDSIINDLNSNSKPTSQEQMPQITDEEREVIMKQKAIQEQEQRQYQMQQQQKFTLIVGVVHRKTERSAQVVPSNPIYLRCSVLKVSTKG